MLTAGTNITLTYDDTANTLTVASTDTGITDVVEDTTPQLGGDLDANGNNISFGDSTTAGTDDTLKFGATDDMLMYHDGTHGYIQVPSGSGNMRIRTGVFNVRSANNNLNQISTLSSGAISLYHNGAKKFDTVSTGVDITGSLDVTDASTTRSNLGLGTAATADTGISSGNVAVFTSGVADDDFLRVNGTNIEGRSASEVASDIGAATAGFAVAMAIAL